MVVNKKLLQMLKTILFLFLSFNYSIFLQAETITLQKALQEKKVKVKITTNLESTHYHTPFQISIHNLSDERLVVSIENGTTLIPDEEEFQNFIVTESQLVALSAKRKIDRNIKAMCIERNDMAPLENTNYTVSSLAKKSLVKLSNFIEKNKQFEPNAQFLMWDIASNFYKEKEIDFFSLDNDGNIVILNVNEKGEKIPLNLKEEIEIQKRELKVYGSFTMNLSGTKKIHIAMFNMDNLLVKELYNNPNTPKGETKMDYVFNSLEFTDEKYQIKLVMNGKVMMKRVVEMDV